ncbi:MoaA/NifB/PqqE/SkfB family radical SAM enzyme [Kitasatospora sp. MAP12-15]|uniref:radical SAM protein n=1 Tax=unclassified Kitasatospora TaxID=2633591 RepID=UPI002473476B|nr:radical SAM protein [Kitasatospora sp. MAP12-44]MDH6114190.1 MoaA/NifB/PqqE/SkfB family radical SAM enzyme [Kitasatospora sp. MAP12-44]
MRPMVKIWYVSSQRLCNFHCTYCVSVKDYAKSNTYDWKRPRDRSDFESIVRWIAAQPFDVGVRLATLGEPFTSNDFMTQAAWLTRQPSVRFVEVLTNGSLLKRRLPRLAADADLSKLSLWITHHHTEITVDRLIDNARFAQEKYGCFTVVNALLFPDNAEQIAVLRAAAQAAGLRFNLDLGYDPGTATGDHHQATQMAPILQTDAGIQQAIALGADPDVLKVNLLALNDVQGQPCSAGHDYLYIGIDGEVYPCSRYYVLKQDRLGNALAPDFRLPLREVPWNNCKAGNGCCNKEDFLNLKLAGRHQRPTVPSLGWTRN